jgi:hypothetical protein
MNSLPDTIKLLQIVSGDNQTPRRNDVRIRHFEAVGFVECLAQDLSDPISKNLVLVTIYGRVLPFWVAGESERAILRNIERLIDMTRIEHAQIPGEVPIIKAYLCGEPPRLCS